ncbi:MAG: hypothetical protein ACTHKZ_02505 [Lysobacteraceae bacterium]
MRRIPSALALLVLLCGCNGSRSAAPTEAPAGAPSAQAPMVAPSAGAKTAASPDTPPPFVDTAWRVQPGSGVEAGTTYTFLRDGTLAIDAPHGTPARGSWRYAGGQLTMVEDGIAYPTDIVTLDATHFVIRSHNPGGVLEIAMERAGPAPPP